MTLSDLKKGDKIKEDCFNEAGEKIGEFITFDHLDGMYSYCTVDGAPESNNVIHLSRLTPLKKVEDYYEIDSELDTNDETPV